MNPLRFAVLAILVLFGCAGPGVKAATPAVPMTTAPPSKSSDEPLRCRDLERGLARDAELPEPLSDVLGGATVWRVARSLSVDEQHVRALHVEVSVDIVGLGGTDAVSKRLSARVGRVERVEPSPFLRLRATREVSDNALTIDLAPEGIGALGPTTLADFDCTEKTTGAALASEEIARWTPAWAPSAVVDALRGASLSLVVLDDLRGTHAKEWSMSMARASPDVSTALDAAATLLGSPRRGSSSREPTHAESPSTARHFICRTQAAAQGFRKRLGEGYALQEYEHGGEISMYRVLRGTSDLSLVLHEIRRVRRCRGQKALAWTYPPASANQQECAGHFRRHVDHPRKPRSNRLANERRDLGAGSYRAAKRIPLASPDRSTAGRVAGSAAIRSRKRPSC